MISNFEGFTKVEVMKEICTIGNFKILFLILATSIVGAVYFRNKNDQLKIRLGDKKDRIIYFKETLYFLIMPVMAASILNFFIKAILFGINIKTLAGEFDIPFYKIFNVSIYVFIIGLLGVSISFLFQITMKPILTATLYPLIIFESFILIFGVSNIFVSERIPVINVISNFTSNLVLNYLDMFMSDLRVEMLGVPTFFMTILAYLALTGICLAGSSRFLITYKKKTLTHNYRSTFLRRSIFLVMVSLFTIYISLAIFASYSLLKIGSITLDKSFEYVAIMSIILIPTLTVFIEYLYMKRNNLIIEKKDKIKNKIEKEKKNKVKKEDKIENNIKVNEDNLKNKGIMKETIEITYKPEIKEEKEEEIEDIFFSDEISIKEDKQFFSEESK